MRYAWSVVSSLQLERHFDLCLNPGHFRDAVDRMLRHLLLHQDILRTLNTESDNSDYTLITHVAVRLDDPSINYIRLWHLLKRMENTSTLYLYLNTSSVPATFFSPHSFPDKIRNITLHYKHASFGPFDITQPLDAEDQASVIHALRCLHAIPSIHLPQLSKIVLIDVPFLWMLVQEDPHIGLIEWQAMFGERSDVWRSRRTVLEKTFWSWAAEKVDFKVELHPLQLSPTLSSAITPNLSVYSASLRCFGWKTPSAITFDNLVNLTLYFSPRSIERQGINNFARSLSITPKLQKLTLTFPALPSKETLIRLIEGASQIPPEQRCQALYSLHIRCLGELEARAYGLETDFCLKSMLALAASFPQLSVFTVLLPFYRYATKSTGETIREGLDLWTNEERATAPAASKTDICVRFPVQPPPSYDELANTDVLLMLEISRTTPLVDWALTSTLVFF